MADLFPAGYNPTQLEDDAARARTSSESADTKLNAVGTNASIAATQATAANNAAAAAKAAAESAQAMIGNGTSGSAALKALLDEVLTNLASYTNNITGLLDTILSGQSAARNEPDYGRVSLKTSLDRIYNRNETLFATYSRCIKQVIFGTAAAPSTSLVVNHDAIDLNKSFVIGQSKTYGPRVLNRTATSTTFESSYPFSYFIVEFY